MKPCSLLAIAAVALLLFCQSRGAAQTNANIDKLFADLKSKDETVRLNAIVNLADHGPKAEPAIAVLIDELQSVDHHLRLNSTMTLGKIGKAALPVASNDQLGCAR